MIVNIILFVGALIASLRTIQIPFPRGMGKILFKSHSFGVVPVAVTDKKIKTM